MQAFSEVDKEDYACSKEILLKGSKNITKDASGKLSVLARKLIQEQKFTPAMSIARVAYKSATKNHVISVVVRAAYIEAQWLNQTGSMNIDRSLDEFSLCTEVAQFHLGPAHPILIAFSDKITHLMAVIDDPSAAIAYMKKSLEASVHTLGGGHPIVAGYHTKLGYLYLSSLRSEEAITEFKQALATFEKTKPGDEAVAENHFVLAEAYSDIGNMEGALFHSMKAVEIREKNFGESHAKTVDSYQQYGKFVSLGYSEYEGVITTRIKEEILHGLRCYEKVFKYMKTKRIETSPYGNSDERKDVLLSLTKTIVGLKLKLIPGQHRQLLRYIREKKQVYDNEFAQSSLLKLLHLTPSVYLEDIFQRLDADKTASKELAVVIQIAESVKSSLNNKK
jgi:tetratricopeptide (TPR) repeat protein